MTDIKNLLETIYYPLTRGNKIIIPADYKDEYKIFSSNRYAEIGNSSRATSKRVFMKNNISRVYPQEYGIIHSWLYNQYIINELGIKWIARELDCSYTTMRNILKTFNIEIRRGYDVVTKNMSSFRSNKSKSEYANRTGWFTSLDRKAHHTQKGVGGFYWNVYKKKYVWLRSTWEYIYAKFLDKNFIEWDTEVITYNVGGKTYRPDFFIYTDNILTQIVEIKGYWKDKKWKADVLNGLLDIDVIIIDDIKNYIMNDNNYYNELHEWKLTRKLKI